MDEQQTSTPSSDNPLLGRRRLGRGLTSLIGGGNEASPDSATPVEAGEYQQLGVDLIERNPYQPRKDFEASSLQELVDSVVQHGVLQPLLVRRSATGFQLIAGERRLIASRKAGLATVPCRIVEMQEQSVSEVAIIENLQRADLNELEKAQAFHDYLQRHGGTLEELAQKLGKDRSTVSNCLRLLELPEFVKVALQTGKISAGHARTLLPLEEEADQIAMCQRIQSESLSVRQTEEQVRHKLQEGIIPFESASSAATPKSDSGSKVIPNQNHIVQLEEKLRNLVGVKVELRMKGKDAGKMIIHFASNDEFQRIVGFLKKAS
jgi:ParB family chromosome partitioning protein